MKEYNKDMNNTIAFIFASASEKNPSKTLSDYDKKLGNYDTYYLCSKEKEKYFYRKKDRNLVIYCNIPENQ